MKVGLFYQMWYVHQKATYDTLKQLRTVYPENEIAMLVTGLPKADVEEYERNFLSIIRRDFNISNIDFLYGDNHPGHFHPEKTSESILRYNDILLEKTLFMLDKSTDYAIFCSEDLYIFKEIPINPDCDVCCSSRPWDHWINEEIKNKLDYDKYPHIPWFQHGHYLNLHTFKKAFTQENREYIKSIVRELYPGFTSIFSDYFTSLWCTLACDTFCDISDYLCELPSELTDETPLETFNRTECHARHGYKVLYGQTL